MNVVIAADANRNAIRSSATICRGAGPLLRESRRATAKTRVDEKRPSLSLWQLQIPRTFETYQAEPLNMELQWARNLQAACEAAGTVFFFKQETAARAGRGADVLGKLYHEYPAAPFEWYTEEEFAVDFLPKKKLVQIQKEK